MNKNQCHRDRVIMAPALSTQALLKEAGCGVGGAGLRVQARAPTCSQLLNARVGVRLQP